jgi:hypothetical protein
MLESNSINCAEQAANNGRKQTDRRSPNRNGASSQRLYYCQTQQTPYTRQDLQHSTYSGSLASSSRLCCTLQVLILILKRLVSVVKMTDCYQPQTELEFRYFNALFNFANTEGTEELGGIPAVVFFNLSGIDIDTLKTIWKISTPNLTMSVFQFHTALRLIALIQNGETDVSYGEYLVIRYVLKCVTGTLLC